MVGRIPDCLDDHQQDTDGMSNRTLIALVAWSFLAIAIAYGWSHWSGAVTSESQTMDGMHVHVTTVREPESRMILLATSAGWAVGVGTIILIGRRQKRPSARTEISTN
jgi:hypothetical protein